MCILTISEREVGRWRNGHKMESHDVTWGWGGGWRGWSVDPKGESK